MRKLSVSTVKRVQFLDITPDIRRVIREEGSENKFLLLHVPHTTAGLTINENADPDVVKDIINKTGELIPEKDNYTHVEGNSDSHLKSSLVGAQLFVMIEKGVPVLGRWQAVYFCEFDGPRRRDIYYKII